NKPVDTENIEYEDLYQPVYSIIDFQQKLQLQLPVSSILECRLISMRVSLIQLLVLLDDLKVFKDEITSIEWKLIDWLDGSSISASTLLLGLIFFYINKEVFKNDKIEIATKIVNKFIAIWFIGFGGENTVN